MRLLLPLTLLIAFQQSTAFDVAVIHRNKSASTQWGIDSDYAKFEATNVTLKTLLESTYEIKSDYISGIPAPLETMRFDLTAKVVDPDMPALKKLSDKQQSLRLVPILEERFHLQAHTETHQLPVYELVLLPGTAKLQPLPATPTGGGGVEIKNHELTATSVDMEGFAKVLTDITHKTVIDRTNLTARYNLNLLWSPDDNINPDNPNPPLITALQEQLGLKLKPAKGPVQTLVVDHIELPTEN